MLNPWFWFFGTLIVADPLVGFLSACPTFSSHCVNAALQDTAFARIAGLIERHDNFVVAAGTIAIAAFTYTLWRSTEKLWKAGEQQIALAQSSIEATRRALEQTRTAERAYVKMSHMPPGLVPSTEGTLSVTMRVQNFGRTPATVTDVIVTPHLTRPGARLPDRPTYLGVSVFPTTQAFLVTNDHIFTTQAFPFPEWQYVIAGLWTLYLFGYVDYIDAFGERHRGGYARMLAPDQRNNNLVFITNTAFNYDVVRQQGEGRDWT